MLSDTPPTFIVKFDVTVLPMPTATSVCSCDRKPESSTFNP